VKQKGEKLPQNTKMMIKGEQEPNNSRKATAIRLTNNATRTADSSI
jgi:hypothetical protein